ncbi:hypothetical protein HMPREF0556_11051 [Listeria grayi DSM 20601]|uniref:Uncharacterized protein n=1 Tax=Listeria grayi DSM 20601 TaxID=525367 RepID=D7UXU0_LISGR|nr:hypothetical protein HMPREF0556_11051 [Listeria grayi DSM 20601]
MINGILTKHPILFLTNWGAFLLAGTRINNLFFLNIQHSRG